jgi:hypothetical protein
LQAHPGIFLPPEAKEVHFFDKHCLDYSLEGYSTLFRAGQGKIKGEITPAYSILSPRRIRFIRAVVPRVKLIFLMRNPIERAWSHALMDLATNRKRSAADVGEEEFLAHFYSAASRWRGDYGRILANWSAVFARAQLFTGLHDDLSMRPCQLLTEIFAFLGVSTTVDFAQFPYEQRIHPGPAAPIPAALRRVLMQLYEEPIGALANSFPIPVERWLSTDT